MAAVGTLTISCTITGTQHGTKGPLGGTSGLTITCTTNEAAAASITQVTLASGFNSITVPATATVGVVIVPATGSSVTKTLKGVTGDTGVLLGTTTPTVLSFASGAAPATIGITASAADTGMITEFWWF